MRRCFLGLMILVLCGGGARAAQRVTRADNALWVGEFDQCSYNALASALEHFYGFVPSFHSRANFERRTFFDPLHSQGFGAYFGWAPWTGFMVNSGQMMWGHKRVRGLEARRFSLATRVLPRVVNQNWILIRFAPGERGRLVARLERELKKGPVIIWTPYAGVLGPKGHRWHMVVHVRPHAYAVPFNVHLTHAVTVFAAGHGKVLVTDCSVLHGCYITSPGVVVAVAAAMAASIRIGGANSIYAHGLKGIHNNKFETVIYRKHRTPH